MSMAANGIPVMQLTQSIVVYNQVQDLHISRPQQTETMSGA